MTWTNGELIWLGAIALGAVIGIAGGLLETRRPAWKAIPHTARQFHTASLAALVMAAIIFAGIWIRMSV